MEKNKEIVLIGLILLLGISAIFFLYSFYYQEKEMANSLNNVTFSDESIIYEKDEQKFIQAKLTLNENYCQEINNEKLKEECLKEINRNKIFLDAIESDNIKLCEVFEESMLIWCQDNYYMSKSSEFNNYQYCDQVQDENRREDCYM